MSATHNADHVLVIAIALDNSEPANNESATWGQIAATLTRHEARGLPTDFIDDARLSPSPPFPHRTAKQKLDDAKNGPCFMLGAVSVNGGPKTKSNMATVALLTIDADNVTDQRFERLLATLSPFEHVWYTTHKNNPATGLWRVRFVIPLAAPLHPDLFPHAWDRLQLLVEGINDTSTRNVNRLNYMPSSPDPTTCAFAAHVPGKLLSLDDLPAYGEAVVTTIPNTLAAPLGAVTSPQQAIHQLATIEAVKKKMRGKPGDKGKWWRLICNGAELAEAGARHDVFLARTFELAQTFSGLDDETVAALFMPSRATMAVVDPTVDTIDAIVGMYRSAVTKIESDKSAEKKHKQSRQDEMRAALMGEPALALPAIEGGAPGTSHEDVTNLAPPVYTPVELETIAAAQRTTVIGLRRRWVLYKDGTFWFLGPSGSYSNGHGAQEAQIAVYRALSRAPITVFDTNASGGARRKTLGDIALEYGSRVDRIMTRLDLTTSVFEPGDETIGRPATLFEATTPVRLWSLRPVEHPGVEEWLKVLCGVQWPKMKDWLAIFPQLDKAIAALYLCGARGAGKGLLAHGLAKLWTDGGPSDPRVILNDFNEMLTLCPVVFVDETLPQVHTTRDVTGKLREEITTYQRPLKRKYRVESTLTGYVRWVFAANDDNMIRSEGAMSRETVAAIAERFFFVDVSQAARDFVVALGEEERAAWATYKIAEHCLYLAATHEVTHGNRLWVDGDVSRMTRELMHANEWASLLCEWLVMYLRDPNRVDSTGTGLIRREHGKLLVNSRAFVEHWATYLAHERTKPSQRRIGEALVTLTRDERAFLPWKGKRVAYREVDLDPILDWNRKHEALDENELLASLTQQMPQPSGNNAPGAPAPDGEIPF